MHVAMRVGASHLGSVPVPVFFNPQCACYALISYKVVYSKFAKAADWIWIDEFPTARMYAGAVLRRGGARAFQIVRSPIARTVSCFMDKYRKQPTRINEPGFKWQACHRLLYARLGIDSGQPDAEIARHFLGFSFDQYIEWLPSIYTQDAHFLPQSLTARLRVRGRPLFRWPGSHMVKVEDRQTLSAISGIDWHIYSNETTHLHRDFEVTAAHSRAIRRLYAADLRLGGYSE